jgi:two-component system response regulator AtoC
LVRGDFPELGDGNMAGEKPDEPVTSGKLLTLDEIEDQYIRRVLKENITKNKGEICEILGISRPTFERKLEKYGITFERE